jgi:hypothetical protein
MTRFPEGPERLSARRLVGKAEVTVRRERLMKRGEIID